MGNKTRTKTPLVRSQSDQDTADAKTDATRWIRDFKEVPSLIGNLYYHLEQLDEDYKNLSVGAKKWLYGWEFSAMNSSTYLERIKEYQYQLNDEPWSELEYLTEKLFLHEEG